MIVMIYVLVLRIAVCWVFDCFVGRMIDLVRMVLCMLLGMVACIVMHVAFHLFLYVEDWLFMHITVAIISFVKILPPCL